MKLFSRLNTKIKLHRCPGKGTFHHLLKPAVFFPGDKRTALRARLADPRRKKICMVISLITDAQLKRIMGINCGSLLGLAPRCCQLQSPPVYESVPYKLWQFLISRGPLLGSGQSFSHGKTSKSSHSQGRPCEPPRMQR